MKGRKDSKPNYKAITAPNSQKPSVLGASSRLLLSTPGKAARYSGAKRSRTPHKSARCYAKATAKYPDENR
jgi:hypothetical protein